MSTFQPRDRWLRDRRGATLVLVAILMIVLVGFAGVAIDFARIYAFKTQLQTRADAAAMAAIVDVHNAQPTLAEARGLAYLQLNPVETSLSAVAIDSVEPGTFTTAGGFSQLPGWTSAVTAVRVKAHYPMTYSLAHIFGVDTIGLRSVAVAAAGYIGKSDCIKPWAMPYAQLLNQIGITDLSHNLTPDDVQALKTATSANNIQFKVDSAALNGIAGNFYAVDFPAIDTVNGGPINGGGADAYRDGIGKCLPDNSVGPGDYLQIENGNMTTPTEQGVAILCPGGETGKTVDCTNGGTTPGVPIKMAIWDYTTSAWYGKDAVHVKYLGAFVVTKYIGNGKNDYVQGYFSSLVTSGAVTNTPGPLQQNGLLVE